MRQTSNPHLPLQHVVRLYKAGLSVPAMLLALVQVRAGSDGLLNGKYGGQ